MDKREIMKALEEVMRSAQELLEWSEAHPGSTLRELEERAKVWKAEAVTKVLEAAVALQGEGRVQEGAVALQGEGRVQEGSCSCGGKWVFQGYRERQVMTSQGVIRVKRAYFTCDRCGAGIFPPGGAVANPGGVE